MILWHATVSVKKEGFLVFLRLPTSTMGDWEEGAQGDWGGGGAHHVPLMNCCCCNIVGMSVQTVMAVPPSGIRCESFTSNYCMRGASWSRHQLSANHNINTDYFSSWSENSVIRCWISSDAHERLNMSFPPVFGLYISGDFAVNKHNHYHTGDWNKLWEFLQNSRELTERSHESHTHSRGGGENIVPAVQLINHQAGYLFD